MQGKGKETDRSKVRRQIGVRPRAGIKKMDGGKGKKKNKHRERR